MTSEIRGALVGIGLIAELVDVMGGRAEEAFEAIGSAIELEATEAGIGPSDISASVFRGNLEIPSCLHLKVGGSPWIAWPIRHPMESSR